MRPNIKNITMAEFINLGNSSFAKARNSEYVDKSGLIAFINETLRTEHQFTCVCRCRRFGKSMAAKMLSAYYDKSCNSRALFHDLAIAQHPTFEQHLNRYPVIYLDITDFTTSYKDSMGAVVDMMEQRIKADLQEVFSDVKLKEGNDLMSYLLQVVEHTGEQFIMIVDEWDAICREAPKYPELMENYVKWLRRIFKGANTDRVFAGVYMTGILPIKQYDTQSALNNFEEYTMVSPGGLAGYFGFLPTEVEYLAKKYHVDKEQIKYWYDGYQIGKEPAVYNPFSVIKAVKRQSFESYWTNTDAYEGLKQYIMLNFDGLKDAIVSLLSGNSVPVNIGMFSNDLNNIKSKDDALSVLIHLGYLSYNIETKEARIPNYEVQQEFENTIAGSDWKIIVDTLKQSEYLLNQTLEGNAKVVAEAIDRIHADETSILRYNDENSLMCALYMAYYFAKKDYTWYRELPAGKGFADLVLIPRKGVDSPAIVIELKYNKDAVSAITQIKNKRYSDALKDYVGNILLVGINYDTKIKKHECVIERG